VQVSDVPIGEASDSSLSIARRSPLFRRKWNEERKERNENSNNCDD
jgi:hypothetical protein